MYHDRNGFYPSTEQGLKALVKKPESNPRPRNWVPSFNEIPRDPWGRWYTYRKVDPAQDQQGRAFVVKSLGPDGIESDDDIER
jgi:general secretion pathway protein G